MTLSEHTNEILFAAATFTGMVAHYYKKNLKNETYTSIKEWFGASHWPSSIASFSTAGMVVITALSNDVILPEMTIWSVLYIGLTTGYAVDSTTNTDGTAKQG
jgi:hypothetical protein